MRVRYVFYSDFIVCVILLFCVFNLNNFIVVVVVSVSVVVFVGFCVFFGT